MTSDPILIAGAGPTGLVWVMDEMGDNFAPLRSLDWQLHVYGKCNQGTREACDRLHLKLHVFGWSDAAKAAGLAEDAGYLVRPGGYVALASEGADMASEFMSFVADKKFHFAWRS